MAVLLQDRQVRPAEAGARRVDVMVLVAVHHPEPDGAGLGFTLRSTPVIEDAELEDLVWENIKAAAVSAIGRLPKGGIGVEVSLEAPEWRAIGPRLAQVVGASVADAVARAMARLSKEA